MAQQMNGTAEVAELPALPYRSTEPTETRQAWSMMSRQSPISSNTFVERAEALEDGQELRLVIGIDFGTTFTGVAYATPASDVAILSEIDVVTYWGRQMGNSEKIPSVISYTRSCRDRDGNFYQQWGSSLSDNAVAMVNTKLQLDIESVSEELKILRSTLHGMRNLDFKYIKDSTNRPDFPRKGPEDIVTDYLKKIFQYLVRAVDNYFSNVARGRFPVDIVATIPTSWQYPAINSTYRALSKAGFCQAEFRRLKDVILVREPEAAAIYTSRHVKEFEGEQFLQVGDCFVLCDAGGGTVDVVSYKVKQVMPTLELELVGIPTGHKSGSIFIDLAFKRWLKDLLGQSNYLILDPENEGEIRSHAAEGERMRELMKAFTRKKISFKNNVGDIRIGLPSPLDTLEWGPAVRAGEIAIKEEDMKSFFDPCVNKIVELLDGQIARVEREERMDVKDVFLVGGFGKSDYLKEEICYSMKLVREINVRVPDNPWTAIVRGAVLVGIEKARNADLMTVRPCPKNYGLLLAKEFSLVDNDKRDLEFDKVTNRPMAMNQMQWLFKKGDAILSNQSRKEEQIFLLRLTESGSKTGEIPIYTYPGEDIPTRFQNDPALQIAHTLKYNLADTPLTEFERRQESATAQIYYCAELRVELCFQKRNVVEEASVLGMALYWKTQLLDAAEQRI